MKIGNHNRKTIAEPFFLKKIPFFFKSPPPRLFMHVLAMNVHFEQVKLVWIGCCRLLLLWIGCFSKLWIEDYLVRFDTLSRGCLATKQLRLWASLCKSFKALFTIFSVHAFTHRMRDTAIKQCKGRKGVHAFTCSVWEKLAYKMVRRRICKILVKNFRWFLQS